MSGAPHVFVALADVKKVIAEHGGVTKDRQANYGERYQYRGIDDLYGVICAVSAAHRLNILPSVLTESVRVDYQVTDKGKTQTHLFLFIDIVFSSAVDGSTTRMTSMGEAIDSGDKAVGKAMSYAMKNAVIHAFQIPANGQETDVEAFGPQNGPPVPLPASPPAPETPPPAAEAPPKKERKPRAASKMAAPDEPAPTEIELVMERVGEVNTFPVLMALAEESDKLTGPNRPELFEAIKNRAIFLFAKAESLASVKEGLPLVKALGSPEDLRKAGNDAYVRFRNVS